MASSSAAAAAQKMLLKSERHLFSSSDDAAVMKQVLATHAPNGREFDVVPLLQIVEDILQRATPTVLVVTCTLWLYLQLASMAIINTLHTPYLQSLRIAVS